MADLDLRPERRDELAAELRAGLDALVPGSSHQDQCHGRHELTSGLLSRGYDRIGLVPATDATPAQLITELAHACARLDPNLAGLSKEVRQVAATLRALRP